MTTPVISFGEIVWDQFDDGVKMGGAPLNVAYHLHAVGQSGGIISRIGQDELGEKTLARIQELGLAVSGIQVDDELPTGLVLVSLDAHGEPNFEIAAPAAWDNIQTEPVLTFIKDMPFHLVFGTLAQRSKTSRNTLKHLLAGAKTKFYDVNLRPPYTVPDLVLESLQAADVVKVNREELFCLADWFLGKREGAVRDLGRELLSSFDLLLLAITEGSQGARLVSRDDYAEHKGFEVKVADPVGSGDAFFATLINGYLTGLPLAESLRQANKRGAWVASQQGATPAYPKS